MMYDPLDKTDLQWLTRLARALLGEAHAADDLVQQTVAVALRRSPQEDAVPRAWLGGVARRLAKKHFRTEARRVKREGRAARGEALPSTAELVDRTEVAERVAAATRALPEPYRSTILLRFLEGATTEEIAERAGKTADTVRWRLRRGLELLREELGQREETSGGSWRALLLPLALPQGDTRLATAATSWTFIGTVATGFAMKLTLFALITCVAGGLWIFWPVAEAEPPKATGMIGSQTAAAETSSRSQGSSAPLIEGDVPNEEINTSPFARPSPKRLLGKTPVGLIGRIVDETGSPIPQAIAYLFPSVNEYAPENGGESPPLIAQVHSDADGAFSFKQKLWNSEDARELSLDLGIVANGYLRRVLPDLGKPVDGQELRIVMLRGAVLRGRIVDEAGRCLPGIDLLATTLKGGIGHVSPSQVLLRADRAAIGGRTSTYFQCRARSDARGEVAFTGLPLGTVRIRSLDPGWTLSETNNAQMGGPFVIWTARPTLGVRLNVFDGATAQPASKSSAVFRVKLRFANGESEDYGQWVGRGKGSVSFALTPDLLPPQDKRRITQATFYGTAKVGGTRVPWKAKPILQPGEVAQVRVVIDSPIVSPEDESSASSSHSAAKATLSSTIALDARYTNGTPCTGRLVATYLSTSKNSAPQEGDITLEPLSPAQYRLQVPPGQVQLRITEFGASGSLSPWTTTLRCTPGRTTQASVTLPQGATITINRPKAWEGEWFVHASFRLQSTAPWQGSWNYSTKASTLTLRALRPADWRFQLRYSSDPDVPQLTHEITLTDGSHPTLRSE